MAIPRYLASNFDTLLRAAQDGNLALMECHDVISGEPRYVICALGWHEGDYLLTPLGHLAEGNPYDHYIPPSVDRTG